MRDVCKKCLYWRDGISAQSLHFIVTEVIFPHHFPNSRYFPTSSITEHQDYSWISDWLRQLFGWNLQQYFPAHCCCCALIPVMVVVTSEGSFLILFLFFFFPCLFFFFFPWSLPRAESALSCPCCNLWSAQQCRNSESTESLSACIAAY